MLTEPWLFFAEYWVLLGKSPCPTKNLPVINKMGDFMDRH
jgi:hypothetical protein